MFTTATRIINEVKGRQPRGRRRDPQAASDDRWEALAIGAPQRQKSEQMFYEKRNPCYLGFMTQIEPVLCRTAGGESEDEQKAGENSYLEIAVTH